MDCILLVQDRISKTAPVNTEITNGGLLDKPNNHYLLKTEFAPCN
jgi:hypothetical protein